jgi:hypothetical protein
MSPALACLFVKVVFGRGEDPLPSPFARRVGVFGAERVRQLDEAGTAPKIARMQSAHALEVLGQRCDQPLGQQRHSILLSLSVANRQLPPLEIDVLYPQSTALQNAQA